MKLQSTVDKLATLVNLIEVKVFGSKPDATGQEAQPPLEGTHGALQVVRHSEAVTRASALGLVSQGHGLTDFLTANDSAIGTTAASAVSPTVLQGQGLTGESGNEVNEENGLKVRHWLPLTRSWSRSRTSTMVIAPSTQCGRMTSRAFSKSRTTDGNLYWRLFRSTPTR